MVVPAGESMKGHHFFVLVTERKPSYRPAFYPIVRRTLASGILTCSILILISTTYALAQGASTLPAVADSIAQLKLNFDRQARIDTLTLKRGAGEFHLRDGTLTLSQPIQGQPVAAVFVGKAEFHMSLPNRAERYMFNKHCKDTVADWDFRKVAFVFTDSTWRELEGRFEFSALGKNDGAQGQLDDFIKYIEGEFEESFPALLLSDLLQPWRKRSFYARFFCDCGRMIYRYEPNEVEEVKLFKHTQTQEGSYPELISSIHSPDQYAESKWGPDHEEKDAIDSLHYDIYCKIEQPARATMEVQLRFQSRVEALSVIRFDLFSDLKEESISVIDAQGDSLFWQKLDDEFAITVFLNQPLQRGEWSTLRFNYSSNDLIGMTPWGSNLIKSTVYWFPRYGYLKRARYKFKFAYPKQMTFLSVGTRISDTTIGDFTVAEYDLSKYPVSIASFNYGSFESRRDSIAPHIPVEVYANRSAHKGSIGGMLDKVMVDVKGSAELFSREVYPYPFDQLLATEIPASHGQGFPGLLHLAWGTFQYEEIGEYDAFRAHEVAHQWWGNVVGWKSYHDQWLSEAFAEYFGAWYVQQKYLNDEQHRGTFYDLMDRWLQDVYESGSFTNTGFQTQYQEGNDAGPIWMGQRLASSRSSDYFTLVYSKGAYVLYMLRMMMFDFGQRDDSAFRAMLADFIHRYEWKDATTADFIAVAEEHYGHDLDWFFDQWVYGIELPEYRWKAEVREQRDGRYEVIVDVDVKKVGEDFRMPVPFTIMMEGGYHTTTRLDISGTQETITIPNIPYQPERFLFNTFKSVLCKSSEK